MVHWPAGSDGRGALLTGDTITVVQDRDWASFMWSFPNLIPLDEHTVLNIAHRVQKFSSTGSTADGGAVWSSTTALMRYGALPIATSHDCTANDHPQRAEDLGSRWSRIVHYTSFSVHCGHHCGSRLRDGSAGVTGARRRPAGRRAVANPYRTGVHVWPWHPGVTPASGGTLALA
jgi:hypothetical protein